MNIDARRPMGHNARMETLKRASSWIVLGLAAGVLCGYLANAYVMKGLYC